MITGPNQQVDENAVQERSISNAISTKLGEETEAASPIRVQRTVARNEAPPNCLQLNHIHGYRGHDTRNTLVTTSSGMMVFSCAAVAIVHDSVQNTQVIDGGQRAGLTRSRPFSTRTQMTSSRSVSTPVDR